MPPFLLGRVKGENRRETSGGERGEAPEDGTGGQGVAFVGEDGEGAGAGGAESGHEAQRFGRRGEDPPESAAHGERLVGALDEAFHVAYRVAEEHADFVRTGIGNGRKLRREAVEGGVRFRRVTASSEEAGGFGFRQAGGQARGIPEQRERAFRRAPQDPRRKAQRGGQARLVAAEDPSGGHRGRQAPAVPKVEHHRRLVARKHGGRFDEDAAGEAIRVAPAAESGGNGGETAVEESGVHGPIPYPMASGTSIKISQI